MSIFGGIQSFDRLQNRKHRPLPLLRSDGGSRHLTSVLTPVPTPPPNAGLCRRSTLPHFKHGSATSRLPLPRPPGTVTWQRRRRTRRRCWPPPCSCPRRRSGSRCGTWSWAASSSTSGDCGRPPACRAVLAGAPRVPVP